MTERKRKPPVIPVAPSQNLIIVERIIIDSKLDKEQKKKNPKVVLSKDMIAKRNKEVLESTNDILSVWDQHPLVGVIVALNEKIEAAEDYRVGDKVGWKIGEGIGMLMVFNKKKYIALYPHDILFRYITNEV